jgi:hypothetical protein
MLWWEAPMTTQHKRVPPVAPLHRWETVDGQSPDARTQRMVVPRGWIDRQIEGPPDRTVCMVCVPALPWHRASQAIRSVADTVIVREPAGPSRREARETRERRLISQGVWTRDCRP